jgi:hypothetical protein
MTYGILLDISFAVYHVQVRMNVLHALMCMHRMFDSLQRVPRYIQVRNRSLYASE